MAAEDRRCCGDPFTDSASTRTPQPNKRQSVGAGRVGAIRRDHAARQCSAAHLGRVAALCTPCSLSGRLFTPLFIRFGGSAEQANKPNKQCLFEHQNGASRPRERRDEFSRFQAWLKPCLGSLEQGTGLQCLWTLWRARIQRPNRREQMNTEQPVGHASDTRSRTLILARDARRVLGHTCVSARAMTSGCTTWSG